MRRPAPALLLLALSAAACRTTRTTPTEILPPDITWGPAPAVFPPGARMAVLRGNPATAAEFTVRLWMPDGYRIPPHTHPTDENVTVISGTFRAGMGEHFRPDSMLALRPGGFVTAPAGHAHFAMAHGETVVQVHALGPFALTYVNPADAPRSAAAR